MMRPTTSSIISPTSRHGGPVYDVTQPPDGLRAAQGDGATDDTEALRDAFDYLKQRHVRGFMAGAENLHLYLPNGVYRVTGPVFYRGEIAADRGERPGVEKPHQRFDILRVRIVGQSRAKTILRLDDRASGFGDPSRPQVVLAYQHLDSTRKDVVGDRVWRRLADGTMVGFNNGVGHNLLRNLTIETGRGNPGAIGLYFQGANITDLRNLTIRSGDGAGVCGLWMPIGSVQGCCFDVTVEGFDYGVQISQDKQQPEVDAGFEHLTLAGQRQGAIRIDNGGLSVRKLRSDQSKTGARAVEINGDGVQVVMLESELVGGDKTQAAIVLSQKERQCIFVRDVAVAGYGSAIQQPDHAPVTRPRVDEYVNYPVTTLFPGTRRTSLRLEIKDAPAVPVFPPEQWVSVNACGAKGDGETDDSPAIQKALDAGKPVVYFPSRRYRLQKPLEVPASIQRIELLGCHLMGGGFQVTENSNTPLLLADADRATSTVLRAPRTVIHRHMSGTIRNQCGVPVETFIENGCQVGGNADFCVQGQKVWGRGLNNETVQGANFVCDGGTLWVFNFKTENKPHPTFHVSNGGRLEVLGGYANAVTQDAKNSPMILVENSQASVTMFTDNWTVFGDIVESRGTEQKTAAARGFPRRKPSQANLLFVPLYVAGPTAASGPSK